MDSTQITTAALTPPHGGSLVDLVLPPEEAAGLKSASARWPSWNLTGRQLCDLELLVSGGFSPLAGFMRRRDYEAVCRESRLADGRLWPIPIVLDVPEDTVRALNPGSHLALRDPEGTLLAALHVEDIWQPDRRAEAEAVYGTSRLEHPGVAALLERTHPWYLGGRIRAVRPPRHYDFRALRASPAQLRAELGALGWSRVVAFQTRNPMHRAHVELTRRAMEEADARLLVHPVVGMTKPGDVDHYTRIRCYEAVMAGYAPGTAKLALLPLAMRMAGPREALWHAIIRKNYGCTHLIVGRDHAGPGADASRRAFYGPYDAQELLQRHQEELGVSMVPFREMLYAADEDRYYPENEVPRSARVSTISGTELRRRLATGEAIPEWFSFPEVVRQLRRTHPPRSRQGVTIFFTGLSGAGKSTIANILLVRLLERGGRSVTLLDGDLVRKHLSSELGFSKEHRDLNIRRVGFVAAEVTRARGVAICAAIAPYDSIRREVRAMIEPAGGFLLVHVATPLDVCEKRDRKGLYAQARAGVLPQFTGVSDPYETPDDADIVIDTTEVSAEAAAESILTELVARGYLSDAGD